MNKNIIILNKKSSKKNCNSAILSYKKEKITHMKDIIKTYNQLVHQKIPLKQCLTNIQDKSERIEVQSSLGNFGKYIIYEDLNIILSNICYLDGYYDASLQWRKRVWPDRSPRGERFHFLIEQKGATESTGFMIEHINQHYRLWAQSYLINALKNPIKLEFPT